jgi:hypothetical protein
MNALPRNGMSADAFLAKDSIAELNFSRVFYTCAEKFKKGGAPRFPFKTQRPSSPIISSLAALFARWHSSSTHASQIVR